MIVLLVQRLGWGWTVRGSNPDREIDFLFSRMFRVVQLLSNNPIKWVTVSSAEVKNEWSCTSTPSLCFMSWRGLNLRFYCNKSGKIVAQTVLYGKARLLMNDVLERNWTEMVGVLMYVLFRDSFMNWLRISTNISVTMSEFWPGIEPNIRNIRHLHTNLHAFPLGVDVYIEYGHPAGNRIFPMLFTFHYIC